MNRVTRTRQTIAISAQNVSAQQQFPTRASIRTSDAVTDPGRVTIVVVQREIIHEVSSTEAVGADEVLKKEFEALARQWRRDTRHVSSIHDKSMSRAYQKIISKGEAIVPFILRDLERTRDHWLWALDIIEDENPAESADSFEDAVDAWLQWGRANSY